MEYLTSLLAILLTLSPLSESSDETTLRWYPDPDSYAPVIETVELDVPAIAERVAYCESGNKNVENPISSASGYFQFISSTWTAVTELSPPASLYPYEVQLEAFLELWDEGRGASHWAPSRACWQHEDPWTHYDR